MRFTHYIWSNLIGHSESTMVQQLGPIYYYELAQSLSYDIVSIAGLQQ